MANKYWTFWEGKEPDWIKMCFESMKIHCPNVIRMNLSNVRDWVDLPDYFDSIKSINHKSDYIKAKLLKENGGWWIDADTIILKEPPEMVSEYAGCPGLFYASRGSMKIHNWFNFVDAKVRSKKNLYWNELIEPLYEEGDNGRVEEIIGMDSNLIQPFSEHSRNIFFEKVNDWNVGAISDSFAIVLYNEIFPGWFKEMDANAILDSDMLISHLFRKSLGTRHVSKLNHVTLSSVADKVNEIIEHLRSK